MRPHCRCCRRRSALRSILVKTLVVAAAAVVIATVPGCGQPTNKGFYSVGGGGGGQGTNGGGSGDTASAGALITVTGGTIANEVKAVTLRANQSLKLRLQTEANTGFAWRLDPNQATSLMRADSPVRVGARKLEQGTATPGSAIGSAIYDVFTIRAVQPATVNIKFIFDRALQQEQPKNTYTVKLTIGS